MFICLLMISFVGLFLWSIFQAGVIAVVQLRRMHQVPCDRCAYFTHDSHLKCAVQPCRAMTEGAIGCRDFEAQVVQKRQLWPDSWALPKIRIRQVQFHGTVKAEASN